MSEWLEANTGGGGSSCAGPSTSMGSTYATEVLLQPGKEPILRLRCIRHLAASTYL